MTSLPKSREFSWSLKPFDSAQTAINALSSGQIEVVIRHELLTGVTTEMITWWFENFTKLRVLVGGEEYPAYLVWHPHDHITAQASSDALEPQRPVQQGDSMHIHELFQRQQRYQTHETALISYFQPDGFELSVQKLGHTIMQLRHSFEDTPNGLRYHSRMVLGVKQGWLKPLINGVVMKKKFSQDKARAWLQHNIEEVGCFQEFLPRLFARRDQGMVISLD